MKKTMLMLAAVLAGLNAHGQMVDKVDIGPMKEVQYIRASTVYEPMGQRVVLNIDYGQEVNGSTDSRVKGPDGKKMFFNSVPAVLNYLYGLGWELRHVYTEYKSERTQEIFLFERSAGTGK